MIDLSTFSANSTGQLNVLEHYGDTFGVDGTQVGVLEQTDQVGFASLLKSQHSGALKPQVGFEILCDFSNETLERQLAWCRVPFLLTFLAAGFLVGAFVFFFDFFADGFLAVLFFGTEALCFAVDFFSFLAGLGLAAGFFFTGDILAAGVLVFFSDLAAWASSLPGMASHFSP